MKKSNLWLLTCGGVFNLLGLLGLYLVEFSRLGPWILPFDISVAFAELITNWHVLLGVGIVLTYLGNGSEPVGRWCSLIKGLNISPSEVYRVLGDKIEESRIPGGHSYVVVLPQRGFLNARRRYLQVTRESLLFELCAMPFGSNFGVSWRCYHKLRIHERALCSLPILGWFIYYAWYRYTPFSEDQALLFQSAVQSALKDTLDEVVNSQGLRALTSDEMKPVLSDLFKRW